jgi:DNA-binding transcriptional MerR regulator
MKRRSRPSRPNNAEYRQMPKYTIGVVSKIVGLPPQMLRRYEEAGLLDPARQDGKNRLYSDEDISIIEEIAELTEQGVNAAGIRYILQMRKQVLYLQQEVLEVRANLARAQYNHAQEDNPATETS